MIKVNENNEIVAWPYSKAQLKADNPNTSFPAYISPEMYASFGMYVVHTNKPDVDSHTQTTVAADAPTYAGGKWTLHYTAQNLSEDAASQNIRTHRNELLEETDVYALSDRTLSDAMRQYRADLRDLPTQSGFPFTVTWPTKP